MSASYKPSNVALSYPIERTSRQILKLNLHIKSLNFLNHDNIVIEAFGSSSTPARAMDGEPAVRTGRRHRRIYAASGEGCRAGGGGASHQAPEAAPERREFDGGDRGARKPAERREQTARVPCTLSMPDAYNGRGAMAAVRVALHLIAEYERATHLQAGSGDDTAAKAAIEAVRLVLTGKQFPYEVTKGSPNMELVTD